MLVLLDECVPRRLRVHLRGHDVRTVHDMNFVGLTNGVLLRRAGMVGIEAFITVDRSIEFQVNLQSLSLGIVVIRSHSNDYDVLQHLTPQIRAALDDLKPGQLIHITR